MWTQGSFHHSRYTSFLKRLTPQRGSQCLTFGSVWQMLCGPGLKDQTVACCFYCCSDRFLCNSGCPWLPLNFWFPAFTSQVQDSTMQVYVVFSRAWFILSKYHTNWAVYTGSKQWLWAKLMMRSVCSGLGVFQIKLQQGPQTLTQARCWVNFFFEKEEK